MRGFGLTIEPLAGGAVRVALRGELDLEHAYTFDEEMRRVEGESPPCLVLDLKGLSFLDSSGLARLLAANRRARRERRRPDARVASLAADLDPHSQRIPTSAHASRTAFAWSDPGPKRWRAERWVMRANATNELVGLRSGLRSASYQMRPGACQEHPPRFV